MFESGKVDLDKTNNSLGFVYNLYVDPQSENLTLCGQSVCLMKFRSNEIIINF